MLFVSEHSSKYLLLCFAEESQFWINKKGMKMTKDFKFVVELFLKHILTSQSNAILSIRSLLNNFADRLDICSIRRRGCVGAEKTSL